MLVMIVFCLLECCSSLVVTPISSVPISSSFERESMRSIVYLEAPRHDASCACSDDIAIAIGSLHNFDNSFTIERSKVEVSLPVILDGIFPSVLLRIDRLRNDATDLIMRMTALSQHSETISCRLALIDGVRCPKWHEDYVKIRLLKTYHGAGTEWVDPTDVGIRAMNYLRSAMDWDLDVKDVTKIKRSRVNDVLIISGRNRGDSVIIPVLHRSPPVVEFDRRLLLTITIS